MLPKVEKGRNWAFLTYPESAPPDWLDILKQTGLKCAISPIHDKDVESETDESQRKAHWHVIACWDGPTTYKVVSSLSQGRLNGTVPKKLDSVRGYYRYLTHADSPEKYQYDPADIQRLNNFDIRDHCEMTRSERMKLMGEVQDFIRKNDLHEYAELLDILRDNGMPEHWEVAATNTIVFRAYIASRRHQAGGRKEDADG